MVSILNDSGDNNTIKRLLVVEDDYDIVDSIRHALRSDGWHNIEVVGSGQATLESIDSDPPDVHVGRLRGKLGEAGEQIDTVFGVGYRFVEGQELLVTEQFPLF